MAKIWVFAEVEESGKVATSALENLAKARELGDAELQDLLHGGATVPAAAVEVRPARALGKSG